MYYQDDKSNGYAVWIPLGIAAGTMALLVLVSNLLVQTPVTWLSADWFTYAQFTFPLTFLVTDVINRLFGSKRAYQIIAVGFVVGGLLSVLGGDIRIGIASVTAFAIGQFLDVKIFNRLRKVTWWLAPLISSVTASLVDTTWFYSVAFIGKEGPWMQWASVDFSIKVTVAVVALLPFRLLIAQTLQTRQQV